MLKFKTHEMIAIHSILHQLLIIIMNYFTVHKRNLENAFIMWKRGGVTRTIIKRYKINCLYYCFIVEPGLLWQKA